jgi:hypothetical protein
MSPGATGLGFGVLLAGTGRLRLADFALDVSATA